MVHAAAAAGFQAAADTYAAARPEYPAALDGWLKHTLGLGPARRAVDLGAGTGKFTGRLVETGASVTAIEPVAAMRAKLAAAHPGVEALEGTAEAMPLADASVDAVVCAQAFHWFATEAALAEIRRVLKPGGVLGLVWNVRDESVDWVAALTAVIDRYQGDAPRYASGAWRKVFPAEGFSALEEARFDNPQVGPVETVVVDRLRSTSFIAAASPEVQAEIIGAIRAIVDTHPALAGKEVVAFPYRTSAFHCRKLG
jgi:SAM-dependent methyltransferase